MTVSKHEILRQFVEFGEEVNSSKTGSSISLSAQRFLKDLKAFNEDPDQKDTLPLFFVNRVKEEGGLIDNAVINSILLEADSKGEVSGFRKERHGDEGFMLYFTHEVRPFASEMCEKHGLGFANIGSQGLSLKDFHCDGLLTAESSQFSVSLREADIVLRSILH